MSDNVWDEELFKKAWRNAKGHLEPSMLKKIWRPLTISPARFRKQ